MEDKPKTLLIVEDDKGLQNQLKWHFDDYEVIIAGDRKAAIDAVRKFEPPVVLQDLGLPPDDEGVEEGLATLTETLELAPHTKIIVVTGFADVKNALRAVELGAYDFYQKPVDTHTLDLIVQRAFQMYQLEAQNRNMQMVGSSSLHGIIASSKKMLNVCRTIEKVGPTNATVLILGESGTGKELLSRGCHNFSSRSDKKFVAINCAAVPENLMESELFGYEKGSFTGAVKRTLGKVETANGGTLFLDEIGDMPLPLQAKLLRFLQERVIERVGGREEIPVDVRVVSATNKDLTTMVQNGSFREDLYYRISEVVIQVPPLREREGDKIILARALLHKYNEEMNCSIKGFSPAALEAMENYQWPGNIRELENKVKSAVIMADGKLLTPEDLMLSSESPNMPINLRQVRSNAEKNAILRALSMVDNNISNAAKMLGVTRPTLYDLIKKYSINTED